MAGAWMAKVRSAAAAAGGRWRQMTRGQRIAAGAVAALAVAGVAAGLTFALLPRGEGDECDEPLCVEIIGPVGDKVDPMTPVQIRLAGDLDRKAAVEALTISNEPAGERKFQKNILAFYPEWPGFARGETYEISLQLAATVVPEGAEPVDLDFQFTTDGRLEVSSVFPADGAAEVALDAPLMVQFTRSVAPLTVIDARGPEGVVEFDPPVEGEGRWLNTSLYQFTPSGVGWAPSTTYTATVKAGLANQLGARLHEDYTTAFTTALPKVVIFFPLAGSLYVEPEPEIKIGFNQPVDRASAEAAFSLRPAGGGPVAGAFEWLDDQTFLFYPAQPLALATTYDALVDAGVRALGAEAMTADAVAWSFTTVGVPRIESTSPQQGSSSANRYGVEITFTNPMDEESVEDRVTITPEPEQEPYLGWDWESRVLFIGVEFEPSSPYRVTIAPGAVDRYGTPLEGGLDLTFTTAPLEPGYSIFRPGVSGTFNAYLDPTIMVQSWNVSQLDFQLYRIDVEEFLSKDNYGTQAPAGEPIRTWSETVVNPPLNEAVVTPTRLAEPGAALPQGLYLVRVLSPDVPPLLGGDVTLPFVVSSANVTTKWSEGKLLAWVVDLQTGQPLADLPLEVLDESGKGVASGTTDAQGIVQVDVPAKEPYLYNRGYYVHAETDGVVLLSGADWADGISPYDFGEGMSYSPSLPPLVGYLYTDRPIYRPGESVFFKGIVREDEDAHYSTPAARDFTLVIYDSQYRLIDLRYVTLSDYGSFDEELTLSEAAPTGEYSATLAEGRLRNPEEMLYSAAYVRFKVAEFRKPEFEVSVTTDEESYVNGDTISATVQADLFFGAPLAGAEVAWKVTSETYPFRSAEYPGFAFGEYVQSFGGCGGFITAYEQQQLLRAEGTGSTDAQGRFVLSVPADVASDRFSQRFVIEAFVTDQNGQSVGAFTSVPVHKGAFYLGLLPDGLAPEAGEETDIELVSIDPESMPVPDVPVVVRVYDRKWRTVRERQPDGTLIYRSEPEDTLIQTIDARTGPDGEGSFAFTPPRSGQYYIVVEGRDDAGNVIQSTAVLWASSDEFASWHIPNDDRFTLVPDREEYQPGETARILVAAPFEASRGLVTLERGSVLSYELRDFATNSDIVEIPITDDHIPTLYVSVVLFKPPTADNPMPQVKFGLVKLNVSTERKQLDITIEPDAEKYEPRQTVTYKIKTTDSEGDGVPAEVSLALVDKAVLTLQDDYASPPMDVFWFERPLSVLTASSYALSIDRANELAISRMQGGGKGGGGGPTDQTRTFFPNTAFWEPALRTGDDGEATVKVDLPDTLTTWRLTARGLTLDAKAGEARNEIVTAKDVIVRPVVPRFLIAGDVAYLGAIVHNLTGEDMRIDVKLEAEGVDVRGDATQSVEVAAGEDGMVRWETVALPDRDSVSLTFEASGDGGASDAVGLELPLYLFVTPETTGTAGEVTAEAAEAVVVPYYVRPDAGELTVRLSPSLAAGVNTALEFIWESPWESADTTVSRFLPALALRRAIEELDLEDLEVGHAVMGEQLDHLVRRSLQRLYNNQSPDGGWNWFGPEDQSDAAITAYVLIGFAEAQRAGFEVDRDVQSRAVSFLREFLDARRDVLRPDTDLRAFVIYALTLGGFSETGRARALVQSGTELSNTAKAWVALSLKRSGVDADDPIIQQLLSELQAAAIPSATGNHWEEESYDRNVFGSSVMTTANVLQAFTAFMPEHPLVDGTLRWLMVARKDGHWESTHDTALALLAITDFMLARKDVQEDFDYRVALNGDGVFKGHAEAGKIHQDEVAVIEMEDLLKDEVNALSITRDPGEAAGRLYYTAHLRYFTPAENVEAANHGIGASHEYSLADGDGAPVTEAEVGDTVKVKVTLVAENDLNFLVVEDYLPAGLEAVDTSLKITPPEFRRRLIEEQQGAYRVSRRYSPFGHADIRDNRVALFARFVPKGVYEYTYFAQATIAGEFRVPPATAREEYFPEVWGRSDGGLFVVKGEETSVAVWPVVWPGVARGALAVALVPTDALTPPAGYRRVRASFGRGNARKRAEVD